MGATAMNVSGAPHHFWAAMWAEVCRRLNAMRERSSVVQISVHKSVPVGQKAVATILQVNGELLLLGVTNSAVTLIRRWHKDKSNLDVRGCVR